ncbi:hypothetical protein LOK49_LG02G03993 [Camellia lanceoleosa]|uniref:Uncharacterized protein n=1 Tax=Camellia lanceoleosa TaxID=1840588 RepID=A0ACC0IIQ0_9ERIC|nr:hypothetical protein LOK49_LG02G03993 [Camellia lanceoleosa]
MATRRSEIGSDSYPTLTFLTPTPTPTPTPRSLNLQSSIDDRRKEQSTKKLVNQSSCRHRLHHFRLDSSLVINLKTSDITEGLETSQQFRWWFGQMLSTCDQLQEKDDA